ncbi:MAG: hypothetical protein RSE61_04180, partial [Anaerovoracaceae bacterium]
DKDVIIKGDGTLYAYSGAESRPAFAGEVKTNFGTKVYKGENATGQSSTNDTDGTGNFKEASKLFIDANEGNVTSGNEDVDYGIFTNEQKTITDGIKGTTDVYKLVNNVPEGATVTFTEAGFTNAGTHIAHYTVTKSHYIDETGTATLIIKKATPAVTQPAIVSGDLTYNGNEQELATAGSVKGVDGDSLSLEYSLEKEGTYALNIPTKKDAGEHTIYYRISPNANYNNAEGKCYGNIKKTIKPKEVGISWTGGSDVKGPTEFVYNKNNRVPTATATDLENNDSCAVTVTVALKKSPTVTTTEYKNVGEYVATASSLNNKNYKLPTGDTLKKEYKITPKSIALDVLTVDLENKVFTGIPIFPEVKDGNDVLEFEKDYKIYIDEKKNNIDVGHVTFEIHGIGNYEGETAIQQFNITAKSIAGATINLEKDVYEYTSSPIYPTIKGVKTAAGETISLEEGKDYTVAYSNNITNAGTATVTITGKGNYEGVTATKEFTINKKAITADMIGTIDRETYTGKEIKPDVTVTHNADRVDESNYTVTYGENINAGENAGTVTITANDDSNYTGEVIKSFTIDPIELKDDMVGLPGGSTFGYTGDDITPEVVVLNGQKTLEKDTHYTVSYESNRNKGTGKVIVKGIGNYSGTANAGFNITAQSLTDSDKINITVAEGPFGYTGEEIKPAVNITYKTIVNGNNATLDLKEDTDYTVEYENNTNAGENTATVTVTGIGNYSGTPTATTFTITPKSLTDNAVTLAEDSYEYTGKEITPEVTVKDGDKTLNKDTDYTVEYENNTNAGENTATVTVTAQGNYTGTANKTFTITAPPNPGGGGGGGPAPKPEPKPVIPTIDVEGNGTVIVKENQVLVDTKAVEKLANKVDSKLEVKSDDASVEFDSKALKEMVKQAGSENILITVTEPKAAELTADQQKVVKELGSNKPVINLEVKVGTKVVSNFGGGKIAVSFDYKLAQGENPEGLEVIFIDNNGKVTVMPSTYNAKTGKLTMVTDHFSVYAVRYVGTDSTGKPSPVRVLRASNDKGRASLIWSRATNNPEGYRVYRSATEDGKYKSISTIKNGKAKTYKEKAKKTNKTYYYKVRAFKKVNGKCIWGAYSPIKVIKF